ncbi:type III PLP-dependent enzyme [Glycomyces xiaoerkulensis]|uniref:type III PLP-dependent enzyme n=1 Tax=Glycomyces xiaoerkulensis TaxID=2038139 RepID=UPI0018E46832|nr:type III PLP-dependent enzyme [Glycomyces xiaoerkulensis]
MQGIPIGDVVAEHGSPAFVYDGDALVGQYRGLRESLPEAVDVYYSLKANPNIALFALLEREGAGAEVSSLTELRTALRAGTDPGRIIFLGPGKSRAELEACCEAGVRAVVVESLDELARLDGISRELGVRQPVMLRINPDFQVKRSGLSMGGKARQFGIDQDQVLGARSVLADLRAVRVIGVHAYMGTRILDADTVVDNTERILRLAEEIAERTGIGLDVVDIGGGLGVPYFPKESELDLAALSEGVGAAVERFVDRHPGTRLILESGRYLVAECGVYVLGVRYVKESFGERFAVADGGTNHHMAAVGIGSIVKRNFPIGLIGRKSGEAEVPWHLTGPLCTPADELGKNVDLPADLGPGDLVGVYRSGAYGPTASPVHFLSHGYPAEVLIHNGQIHLIRMRDTPEEMLRRQLLPDFGRSEPTDQS